MSSHSMSTTTNTFYFHSLGFYLQFSTWTKLQCDINYSHNKIATISIQSNDLWLTMQLKHPDEREKNTFGFTQYAKTFSNDFCIIVLFVAWHIIRNIFTSSKYSGKLNWNAFIRLENEMQWISLKLFSLHRVFSFTFTGRNCIKNFEIEMWTTFLVVC